MFGETTEFGSVEHFGIDHAHKQRFNGALAEPIDDALDGAACYALPRLGGSVDKGAVFDGVRQVAFLFEPAQDCSDGRVLKRAVEVLPHLLSRYLAEPPDDREDAAFQFTKFSRIVAGMIVTRHSVTDCNT